ERTATLDKFRRNEITLLVCSDVAARGLDIEALSHVFNFDVPFAADDYVHRIGRTGRAGLSGTAITLVTPEEDKLVDAIESLIKKRMDRETLTDLPEPKPRHGRGDGRREGHGGRSHSGRSHHPHRRHSDGGNRNTRQRSAHPPASDPQRTHSAAE